jgi:STE24 endopeptidase
VTLPLPPHVAQLVDALYPPARQALAYEVAAIGRRVFWLGATLQLAALLAIYYSGAATALRSWLDRIIPRPFWSACALIVVIGCAVALVMLPLTWYDSYTILHRYDLSRESPALWFHDWAVALALGVGISALGGAGFFRVVRRWPRAWPLVAGVLAAPIVLVATVLLPVVIEPLFNQYTPLPQSALTDSILELAAAHGVKAASVYEFDLSKQSTSANAFVSGLGGTDRIALSDNLLASFKPDEILYVTAHELGHYVHRDLWRGALYSWLGALVAIAFLWLTAGALIKASPARASGLSDPAAAPLLMALLLVFALATEPIANALSRQIEHNADVFAAANTHLGEAGVRAFARLGSQGLSSMHPAPLVVWYFYTHPPLDERIWYAAHEAGLSE